LEEGTSGDEQRSSGKTEKRESEIYDFLFFDGMTVGIILIMFWISWSLYCCLAISMSSLGDETKFYENKQFTVD